ncbi:hypothetical protein CPB84DRAFT_1712354 [Gymnopilus junonius]|uniref:NAD(P)-binding protein n=1 Tax=Gymnopilus junonius TaxID=109634 RepID=A0A9P5NJ71_GYMJU|nr:hypothetical protein CPB84DRAFT_1712354 [Gymnopilus junonius]
MPSWLITGANRGIGLSIVEALVKKESNFVIGTTRSDSAALNELATKNKNFKVLKLDITNQASVDAAVVEATPLLPKGLDYFVNNAGKAAQELTKFEDLDLDIFAEEIKFSTVDVLRVSRAFLPLIKKSEQKKIIFVSSVLASSDITFMMVNQFNAYSVSKAALNMLAHKWGASLKGEGVITAALHPGWVQTEIGAPLTEWMTTYAPHLPPITTEEAAGNVIRNSEKVTLETTAAFWQFDGTNLPW